MSRKPIDQQQPTECRQAVWEWIRNHVNSGEPEQFTIGEIAKYVRLELCSIRDYVIGLCQAGYLRLEYKPDVKTSQRGHYESCIYIMINDTGHDAPRVRKDGTPVTMGRGRLQMWNTMQVVKEFSARELAAMSSIEEHVVAEAEAKAYCAALCKAGYLVGRANQRYLLVTGMWTGPQPPQIQRTKQIYDPNLKRVVWSKIEGGAE